MIAEDLFEDGLTALYHGQTKQFYDHVLLGDFEPPQRNSFGLHDALPCDIEMCAEEVGDAIDASDIVVMNDVDDQIDFEGILGSILEDAWNAELAAEAAKGDRDPEVLANLPRPHTHPPKRQSEVCWSIYGVLICYYLSAYGKVPHVAARLSTGACGKCSKIYKCAGIQGEQMGRKDRRLSQQTKKKSLLQSKGRASARQKENCAKRDAGCEAAKRTGAKARRI